MGKKENACVIATGKLQCGFCVSPVWAVSVRSYTCTDLLNIREGSPLKGGFHGTHGTPSRSITGNFIYTDSIGVVLQYRSEY